MGDSENRPRIRAVEAIATVHEGKDVVVLRDPEGFATRPILLSERAAFLVAHMDGGHTLLDLQAAYTRRFGDILFAHDLEALVRTLDEASLLDGETFRARREDALRAYREADVRPQAHLSSYEADPETWGRWIDGFFDSAGEPETPPPVLPLRGLVVPHIDLRLGGPVYASGWKIAREDPPPSLVVVLGTCHAPLASLVAATTKDFDTPLGVVPADSEFLRSLDRTVGGLFDDELAHRSEHTIEFQALFVRALFPGADTKIAPILCGYSHLHFGPGAPPEARARIEAFDRALASAIAGRSDVLLVASADLSHVGPRYGDSAPPTAAERSVLEASDRALIESVVACDPNALTSRMRSTGDRTRVCGFAPIRSVLAALGGGTGTLLRYDQGTMGDDGSIVSYASIALSATEPRA
ncbi:MAG: AmmeMemoRadiSam system protein B [Candidatus Latescibacterota bacterium]|nr:MAG: AmmeMemoRadiSam system protein B [Candidatus Latescibacterota bacterium]